MSYIAEIGGVTIVVVFLASLAHSALGVRRYTRFARWFRALPLPGASSSGAPVLFLLVELGAVVLLLMPATSRYGAAFAAAMCVVFGAVTAYLASLPEPPSCACVKPPRTGPILVWWVQPAGSAPGRCRSRPGWSTSSVGEDHHSSLIPCSRAN